MAENATGSREPSGMGEPTGASAGSEGEQCEVQNGAPGGLNEAQQEVLERCLHALKHSKNDSHTLAALLLITRLCPANQLDKPTLRRIFEAVGLNLPARLLVTATRDSGESSGLAPNELLSLGTALLAALSTDPDLAHRPQLLSTVPVLLQILSQNTHQGRPEESVHGRAGGGTESPGGRESESNAKSEQKGTRHDPSLPKTATKLDQAIVADCYQVLFSVCTSPLGPEQLLSRGAVPALCQTIQQNQTLSHEKGMPLLGCLLCGKTKGKAWSKHPAELFDLLSTIVDRFCRASERDRLDLCATLIQFLPPAEAAAGGETLREVSAQAWGVLRPMLQSKLPPRHTGPALALAACLLDVCGWDAVGTPRFCCLLVNRACVEVRMGLEEPPGTRLSTETQHILTGCYRIMEAAMEQACLTGTTGTTETTGSERAPAQSSVLGLSLQQSRQVLGVLQEAFSAVIYHLQQVERSRFREPFVFASFRALCSWLAEETSCLKEEVTALLPFLIGYCRSHMTQGGEGAELSDWMERMSVGGERAGWTGKEPLRYLLPALCHLSAEDGPRKVLLALDAPLLLVDFLHESWSRLHEHSSFQRDPSLETACSALLNVTVTEPQRVKTDPCFLKLEELLSEALPIAMHEPTLLVLAANFCTLALLMTRLRTKTESVSSCQRCLFSCCVRFLRGPLAPAAPAWDEAAELWRLSLQALGSCVGSQRWTVSLIRDESWLRHTLSALGQSAAVPPDDDTRHALEEALCALAQHCPASRRDMHSALESGGGGGLRAMTDLRRLVSDKEQ